VATQNRRGGLSGPHRGLCGQLNGRVRPAVMDRGGGSFLLVGTKLGVERAKIDSTKMMCGTSARGAAPYIWSG
jgi:hypothetical protein